MSENNQSEAFIKSQHRFFRVYSWIMYPATAIEVLIRIMQYNGYFLHPARIVEILGLCPEAALFGGFADIYAPFVLLANGSVLLWLLSFVIFCLRDYRVVVSVSPATIVESNSKLSLTFYAARLVCIYSFCNAHEMNRSDPAMAKGFAHLIPMIFPMLNVFLAIFAVVPLFTIILLGNNTASDKD